MNHILEKLCNLRLSAMARALEDQVRRGHAAELSFEDRLALIVDSQWLHRNEQRIQRRLKSARLKQGATSEDIDYRYPRGLDRTVVQDLLGCHWIGAHRNVIITGATGLGKTWLGCAFADQACKLGYTASYSRVPRLIHELALARADGTYLRMIQSLARLDLLVLDDWGLSPLDGQAQHDLLELIDDRVGHRSILVTSQLPTSKWHSMVAEPSVADAMLDRLLGSAQVITLKGDSMRKPSPKAGDTKTKGVSQAKEG